MTVVAAHQPNYIPWIGYFHKIHHCDTFVYLDHVEYSSGSWMNRNRIKTPDGWSWLTVPVQQSDQPIKDTEINTNLNWREEHRKTLEHMYGKAAFFDEFFPILEDVYLEDWASLDSLNTELVHRICDHADIDINFVRSSTLNVHGSGSDLILEICRELDADEYFSGQGAKDYMVESEFDEAGTDVNYQSIDHPEYEQRFDEFVPNLSIVDVIMNVGAEKCNKMIEHL